MNYLTHGIRYLDRPYFLIGSAIPDLLSVVNRRSRVRRRVIEERLDSLLAEDRELALGMRQHLIDDQWFHSTPGFYATTGELSRLFRQALGLDEEWNCGFLGHIVTELLIDACLSEDHPGSLNAYYAAFAQGDSQRVEMIVTSLATQPPGELVRFIELFLQERFLEDYANNERLLFRLNQVMRRVGTRQLPEKVLDVLQAGRGLIRRHLHELLPAENFSWNSGRNSEARPVVAEGKGFQV